MNKNKNKKPKPKPKPKSLEMFKSLKNWPNSAELTHVPKLIELTKPNNIKQEGFKWSKIDIIAHNDKSLARIAKIMLLKK